jgi:signal transduction histidine kinase
VAVSIFRKIMPVKDVRPTRRWHYVLRILLLSAAYAAAAHLGTALAYTRAPVVAVWLPAGVAVATLLLSGWSYWPAVTIGSIVATMTTGGPLRVAPGVALGATLGVMAAYAILRNPRIGFRLDLSRVRDIFALLAAIVIAPVVSSTTGTATLWIFHRFPSGSAVQMWKTWGVGDFIGILLLCPLLLTWCTPMPVSRKPWYSPEAGILVAAISGLSWLSFSSEIPLSILLAPVLLWAALRFGQRGSSLALLIVSGIAIWNTYRGLGPFTSGLMETRLLALQVFIAVGSITLLFLSAATTERDVIQGALRQARDELEQKVAERTARLGEANAQLASELAERERAEAERRMLEAQMLQAQKLESLGLLAGGIAHDFNNILTAILGHADLALASLPPGSTLRSQIKEIRAASQRAAELAGQMLSYSGRVPFAMTSLDLTTLIREMPHLLEASVSKKARLIYRLEPSLPRVEADPTQLRQVVMNLIINASEAIGDVNGTIELSTRAIDDVAIQLPANGWLGDAPSAGSYVALEVADTGCGMDAGTRSRIFDPFFTTKFTGRGLGLATVLGIVRGHKGHIRVESETGRGTKFTILLASSSISGAGKDVSPHPEATAWSGTGTVLIVDDEEGVRQLAKAMVEHCGLQAVLAADGAEAVETFRGQESRFACVILDMTMPQMNGIETLKELRRLRPDVPIILSSGYPQQGSLRDAGDPRRTSFIQKPYLLADFAARLRDAIEQGAN